MSGARFTPTVLRRCQWVVPLRGAGGESAARKSPHFSEALISVKVPVGGPVSTRVMARMVESVHG